MSQDNLQAEHHCTCRTTAHWSRPTCPCWHWDGARWQAASGLVPGPGGCAPCVTTWPDPHCTVWSLHWLLWLLGAEWSNVVTKFQLFILSSLVMRGTLRLSVHRTNVKHSPPLVSDTGPHQPQAHRHPVTQLTPMQGHNLHFCADTRRKYYAFRIDFKWDIAPAAPPPFFHTTHTTRPSLDN